ncbi:efflux transporter outer membrane subunit [Geovibrio thiophilus]|uniref:Efflux transporter outer membrane subunit n=1 Tax=Geovibrio thiophilus TaxID=139438 RepID=A0A410JZA0_9BACT|nr:efflux transporter outer membrane subunit [Geovibrio thiophilus]QAR33463.1 efflux transporter outer membrane subunit [Geovibrio thiophilus]
MKIRKFTYAFCVSALLFSAGCAAKQTENFTPPVMPAAWIAEHDNKSALINSDWWKSFNSPVLAELIDRSLKQSPDITTAAESIIQAKAQLKSTGASMFPSVNLSGGSSVNRSFPSEGSARTSESSSLSLGVSYEVDVWGRISAQVRGAKESLKAAEYDYDAVRLTLVSGVANGYFQLLSLEKRIEYAEINLETAERILKIVQAKYRNGSALKSELLNQESTVLSRKSTLLSLEEEKKQTLNALAVLTGTMPQDFSTGAEDFGAVSVPAVTAGLPSDLLLRRPDLVKAEAQIAAADANAAAARAALFPTLSLSGSAGLATDALLSLANPATSIGLSASVVQSIFDGGTKRSQITISESQKRVLAENYRKSVLTALQEVEDALNSVKYGEEREEIQNQTTAKLEHSLRLTEIQYREGSNSLSDVLDAQTSLFQARDQLASLRLTRINAAVDMFKVLGGGWEITDKIAEK